MHQRIFELIRSQNAFNHEDMEKFWNRNGKFENAVVINMASRADRLQSCRKTLEKIGISWKRFSAIVGKDLQDPSWAQRFPLLRPGELGCLLSHLSVAAIASKHPDPDAYTVIFEDDIVTSSGHDAWKSAIINIGNISRSEQIDLVYFGKCLERCSQMVHVMDNIYRAAAPSCCHAYAIRNGFAKRVITDLGNSHLHPDSILNSEYFNRGIDSIYGDYIINGMASALVLHPAIFYQDVLSGGSDLRQEFLINYQECNDTNPPCNSQTDVKVVTKTSASSRIIIGILLLIIVIIAILAVIRYRKNISGFTFRHQNALIAGGAGLLGFVLAAAFVIVAIVLHKCRGGNVPTWLEGFPSPDESTLHTTLQYCRNRKSESFPLDSSDLLQKGYKVFNPNGFYYGKKSNFHYQWTSSDEVFISTSRCSNGRNSYPLIRVYNARLDKLLESHNVIIQSHKLARTHHILGYEDMRIFMYKGDLYMIGVNLDRNVDNVPSMFLVRLNWNFSVREDWHLRYEPISKFPNKNWAPLELPRGELGFIVDLHPLLIVARDRKFYHDDPSRNENHGGLLHFEHGNNCHLYYEGNGKDRHPEKIRNSTIVYKLRDLPQCWQTLFGTCETKKGRSLCERYVLLGHKKYVEADFVSNGHLILYQHYIAIVDLELERRIGHVWFSKPFHVEEPTRPHIEYISGFAFRNDEMLLTYGLRDEECRYQILSLAAVQSLM